MSFAASFTGLGLLAVCGLALETRRLLRLQQFEPLPDERLPALSIVVAARDEAGTVGPAVASLLALDYPDLEIVFVDDRSQDGTAQAVRETAASHPGAARLKLIENRELPEGWLGKVHALHLGVKSARGGLILLTDADVVFAPDALKRAVSAQQILAADHLAVLPYVEGRGFWEPSLVTFLAAIFLVGFRPASLHRSHYRFIGVGAFTLLTRSMLEQVGWLEPLRFQVIDDGFLGMMVKARRGRQFALMGHEQMSLRWFDGLSGLVLGLEKNAYAATGYRLSVSALGALGTSAPLWLPILLGCLRGSGWGVAFYLLMSTAGLFVARATRVAPWTAFTLPLAGTVYAFALLRSAWLTERRGAVVWRNTAYSLEYLRSEHHAFFRREWERLRSVGRSS